MTKKNSFAYKLFFSVNISDFIFYVTIATPHEKGHPLFPTTLSKSWGPVKPPFLKIWLKVQPLGGAHYADVTFNIKTQQNYFKIFNSYFQTT